MEYAQCFFLIKVQKKLSLAWEQVKLPRPSEIKKPSTAPISLFDELKESYENVFTIHPFPSEKYTLSS